MTGANLHILHLVLLLVSVIVFALAAVRGREPEWATLIAIGFVVFALAFVF